jgi:hypothetical protein
MARRRYDAIMPGLRPILWLIAAALLGACTARVPYPLGIAGRTQATIAIAPATLSAPVHRPSDIGNTGGKADLDRDLAAVRHGVDAYARGWLRRHPGARLTGDAASPGAAALAEARRQGADLLLAVDVAGYGHIKRRWIGLLFGSGVIEGISQGVLATHATGSPVIGVGVGAEEMVSEGLTWIGGSWLWGKYFAPVTLEGSLWRVRDGKLVWRDIVFADNSDEVWLLLTGKKLPGKRQALATSLSRAEGDLFRHLGRYMHKDVLVRRRQAAGGRRNLALGPGSSHASP